MFLGAHKANFFQYVNTFNRKENISIAIDEILVDIMWKLISITIEEILVNITWKLILRKNICSFFLEPFD